MTSVPFVALIVLAAAQAPGSPQPSPEPLGTPPTISSIGDLPETAVGKQSFDKLFTGSEDDIRKARAQLQAELASQPAMKERSRIVCGMVVMQADPGIDPKMIHRPMVHPPAESTTTFHIKRIPPPTCAE